MRAELGMLAFVENLDPVSSVRSRVLVVEDDATMREFFAASVQRCPELTLVASVGTVEQAKEWLSALPDGIDVLLADLGLPDGSGLDVIRFATQQCTHCESLVISMFGDEDNVLASIEAGALGYIHKDAAPDDIAQTILEMRAGASPISPMIARRVLAKYRSAAGLEARATLAARPEAVQETLPDKTLLSPREQDVLALIARGFSYQEIARLQGLSVHTIQTHIKKMYLKLAVHSKSEAVFEATRMGLL